MSDGLGAGSRPAPIKRTPGTTLALFASSRAGRSSRGSPAARATITVIGCSAPVGVCATPHTSS
jgi:hypothetical protein